MPLSTGGFYYRVMGRDFIAVDSRLPSAKKLFVLFHELGHFLFHTPESGATANFHSVGRRTRVECEADLFTYPEKADREPGSAGADRRRRLFVRNFRRAARGV